MLFRTDELPAHIKDTFPQLLGIRASTDPITRFKHGDRETTLNQVAGGAQTGLLWFNLGGHHDKSDMISVG
ncbi:hypothetical protein, partial [Candidatus Entotheonella palauensis]|uniref:hypothetical protein n=1 Tax=Candidatus Entotheonella palauensis TaxID=93172 RepID=UPI002118FC1C